MSSDTQTSFADSGIARMIAALIAIGLLFVFYVNWSDDISNALSVNKQDAELPVITQSDEGITPVNAALSACLTERVGHVDKMKEDGILSDAQYAGFRDRAESLCRQQNPG